MARKLTHQQQRRVQSQQQKYHAEVIDHPMTGDVQAGLLIVRHGSSAYVETADGSIIRCHFRQNLLDVVAGDQVRYQLDELGAGVILAIMPRQSLYTRQADGLGKSLAANMTQLLVVFAPEPCPTTGLLDKYLIAAELSHLPSILVFNKADLLPNFPLIQEELRVYRALGYPVLEVSTLDGQGFDELKQRLQHEVTLFVGQSGVGKSSLIKRLVPDRDIRIGAISGVTGFGCHTTSNAYLYHLNEGGTIIDTAGVRDRMLGKLTPLQLLQGFIECRDLIGQCKFRDCSHQHEPSCAIIEAVKAGKFSEMRYNRFLGFLNSREE